MSNAPRIDRAGRLFRLLLRCYPARFRHAYGREMELVFRRKLTRAADAGAWPFIRTLTRACLDLVVAGIAERGAERVRSSQPRSRGDAMPHLFLRDLRLAGRVLRRRPGFAAAVVLTLTLGIGATTAIVSLVDAAIVRPLPYPAAGRLMALVQEDARFGTVPFAIPFLSDFRERLSHYDVLVAFTASWQVTLTGAGEPQSVPSAFVSDGLFETFGARAISGRLLSAEDHRASTRVAVFSERLWARTFGAGTPLRDQIIRVNDEPFTVVGIVPDTLRMPITSSIAVTTSESAELWLPLSLNPLATLRTIPVANIVGRLKPHATAAQASLEIGQLARPLSETYREVAPDARFAAVPLKELVTQRVRRPLLSLLLAVAVLLLIACANVANLMLARSTGQVGDLAVRAALGASRGRLMQQVLAESCVLAAAGTAAGVLLAWIAIAAVPSLALGDLPPSASLRMNGRVVVIASLAGSVVAVLVALVPALQSSRARLFSFIRDGARTIDAGGRRARGVLVIAEIALAMVLLVSAGLLARSFWALSRVDPGFRAEHILASGVSMPATRYASPEARLAFIGRTLEAAAAVPGVTRVAAVNRLPLSGGNVTVGVEIEGQPQPQGPSLMDRRVVTAEYFALMGIPLKEGRTFNAADRFDASERVAIINDAIARRFWPGGGVIDRRLRLMLRSGPGPWLRIVGIAGNVRHHGLDQPPQPEVYVPYAQAPVESMVILTQAAADPLVLAAPVRRAVQQIDPELPLRQELPVKLLDASVAQPRLRALLFNGFAMAALLLAALGIYGVVSQAVARRTREIGVRLALGATRRDILRLVMAGGLRTVGTGIVAGLAASLVATRALRGLLFGVPPLDPLTFAVVTSLLAGVAALAILIPARRAMQLDPIRALRID